MKYIIILIFIILILYGIYITNKSRAAEKKITELKRMNGKLNFIEYINNLNDTINKNNMFSPPLEPQIAINYLIQYLLGEDWYVVDPISTKQVNTQAVHEILYKYSKKYRKEYKLYKQNK